MDEKLRNDRYNQWCFQFRNHLQYSRNCKENQMKPYDYFEHLLAEIPKHMDDNNNDFLAELLLWSDIVAQLSRQKSEIFIMN